MGKKFFAEILKTDLLRLSKSEIEAIMDEELNKDPEVIDTELIDLCLEALEGQSAEVKDDNVRSFKKKITLKKALFIAAVIAMLLLSTLSISADYINIDTFNRIVFYKDGRLQEEYVIAETNGDSKFYDIEEAPFPQELLAENYENRKENYKNERDYEEYTVEFSNVKSNAFGYYECVERKYENSKYYGNTVFDPAFNNVEEFKVGNIDVLLFTSYDNEVIIKYNYGNLECRIDLFNCSHKEAVKIIKSIK